MQTSSPKPPEYQRQSKVLNAIHKITVNTRHERLHQKGHENANKIDELVKDNEIIDPLLGECHINAITLADKLYHSGYTPIIILGSLTTEENKESQTHTKNKKIGSIHTWVELPDIPPADKTIAEICKETEGGIQLTNSLPNNYTYNGGKQIKFEPNNVHPTSLRTENGLQKLEQKGLVEDINAE